MRVLICTVDTRWGGASLDFDNDNDKFNYHLDIFDFTTIFKVTMTILLKSERSF